MTENPTPILAALDLAEIIIERRNTLPILDNVLLTSDGSTLVVEASDIDTEVAITLPLDEPGSSFVASAGLAPVRAALDYLGGSGKIEVRGNRSRLVVGDVFELSCLDPSDFPRLKPFAGETTLDLDADELLHDLLACAPAMSREETRYYLNGVLLHGGGADENRSLKLAATDGHRLVRASRPVPESLGHDYVEAIIPRKLVKFLIKALPAHTGARVSFRFGSPGVRGSTMVEIGLGQIFVRSRCIDGTFPDYPRVIPTTEEGALIADAAELARAISAVNVIHGSGDRTRAAVLTFGGPDEKTISASNPENGSMSLPCPGVREGNPPPRIGLNADYLETMLGAFEGEVRIGFGDAAGPVLFRSTAGGNLVGVQMPMRV